jgi:tRNA dimethylallyltransferase
VAAARIGANDRQRIQRALEVLRLTGRPLATHWADGPRAEPGAFRRFALLPPDRGALHARIAARFDAMLAAGLVGEVAALRDLPGIHADLPALRAVGYRQLWAHVQGARPLAAAREQAIAATRQLARRQLTWLRSEPDLVALEAGGRATEATLAAALADALSGPSG